MNRIILLLTIGIFCLSATQQPRFSEYQTDRARLEQFNAANLLTPAHTLRNDTIPAEKKRASGNFRDLDRLANRNAVWGFIFGLASILLFPLLGIPGLIFSNEALREERIHPRILTKRNRTFAYIGKICSIVGITLTILVVIYAAFLIAFLSAWG